MQQHYDLILSIRMFVAFDDPIVSGMSLGIHDFRASLNRALGLIVVDDNDVLLLPGLSVALDWPRQERGTNFTYPLEYEGDLSVSDVIAKIDNWMHEYARTRVNATTPVHIEHRVAVVRPTYD